MARLEVIARSHQLQRHLVLIRVDGPRSKATNRQVAKNAKISGKKLMKILVLAAWWFSRPATHALAIFRAGLLPTTQGHELRCWLIPRPGFKAG
jgi:hypothetical protein